MAMEIALTQGYVAIVDDSDYQELSQWKWCYDRGYAVRRIKTSTGSRTLGMHAQIMRPTIGQIVDHRDMNRCNNQRCNLRLCSRGENNRNRRSNNGKQAIQYKGVFLDKRAESKPWYAQIKHEGQTHFLGTFASPEDAANAYNAAAITLHGDYARLNDV